MSNCFSFTTNIIIPVRHGLLLSTIALILGICWAGYLAINHEQLHGGFEKQEAAIKSAKIQLTGPDMTAMMFGIAIPRADAHDNDVHPSPQTGHAGHGHEKAAPAHQHSHSGSLATDAMQRLLRGHIHWMGVGILSTVMLLITAFTSLKCYGKKLLGWTFGIGAVAYPLAWILMGFRTVRMGPDVAEDSVMWLFGPAAGLILFSLATILIILLIETTGLAGKCPCCRCFFDVKE